MKKPIVLVTGSNGLLGKKLIENLNHEFEVMAIVHTIPENKVKGVNYLQIDLADPGFIQNLPTKADKIVHLAQSNYYRDFPKKTEDIFQVNVSSTVKLLDYALSAGVKKFILASSGGVYGTSSNRFSEDTKIIAKGELGFYIGTRLCSELLSESYNGLFDVICLRFFFAYGPTQKPHMLIPRLVESVSKGLSIKLQGQNGISINPIYVDDAVIAIENAIKIKGSHKINVAGSDVLSIKEIAETIGKELGIKPIFDISPAVESSDLIGDISLMKKILHTPNVSFSEGIKYYLSNLAK